MSIVNNKTRRYLIPANYNFHDYAENFKRFFDLEKGNTETIFSVKATRYLVRKRINKALTVEFLTTEGLNTTKGLNDAIAIDFSMSEMPPGHGFLLQCVKFKPSGVKYRFIDTTSIKPAYIPPSTFIRPKNYEKVAGFVELQASKRIPDKDVNSLFKEPDDRISAPHRKPAN
jgi:hypothetical protein